MGFLNSLLLVGLAASALPIIIHLINRRRAVRRSFPALEFLRRSQKKLARSLKVRQRILLALRVLALLLLALAMARPYLLSDEAEAEADRLPTAVVFVVDDSASMNYGQGEVWRNAQVAVADRLDKLRPWDKASLVFASKWPTGIAPADSGGLEALTDDLSEIRRTLQEHQPAPLGTDLVGGLRTASEMIAGAEMPQGRIILVTDRQKNGFSLPELPTGGLSAPVELLDVRDAAITPNIAVTEARYTQKSTGARPEFLIEASIRNEGDEDVSGVEVRLIIEDNMIGAGLVDIPARSSVTKSFTHRFSKRGLHRASIQLGPGADDHEIDNTRYVPIQLAQKIRVLLVNGDPRSVPYQDEAFYLERALNPSRGSRSTILTDITAVEGLASHPFEDYDIVVLANVEKMPRASVGALTRFVEQGGGLLFTAGDKVNAEVYNPLFGALLPKPVRSARLLAQRDDPDAPLKVARFGQTDPSHPIFRVFTLPGGETLHKIQTWTYLLLEPTPDGESRVLASWSDGAPLLVEKRIGEGRSMMLTTTVDRGWSDLPLRTAFLPLVRRVTQHLARRGASGGALDKVEVGQAVLLEPGEDPDKRYEVRDPSGGRIVLVPVSTEPGAQLRFVPTEPGHYKVVQRATSPGAEPEEIQSMAFAVNLTADEADLTAVSAEEISQALVSAAGEEGAERAMVDRPGKRVGFWSILLFLVTLLLLAETILGTRRSVLRRLWNLLRGRPTEVTV